MAKLSGEKRRFFRTALELRLRRAQGNAFQELASAILAKIYGDDFVPQCPWGSKGDLSCDGYLQDPATVFACYGPENGGATKQPTDIVTKAKSDFVGACEKWVDMKEWVFVYNFVNGVPGPVTNALEALAKEKNIRVRYFGKDKFERELLEMDEEDVEDLIGEIPMRQDYIRLQPAVVQEVVLAIAGEFSLNYLAEATVPVPADKLEINKIPACHAAQIKNGLLARDTVNTIVSDAMDPSLEAKLSDAFRGKYLELKHQGLMPGEIVDSLYEFALCGHRETTEHSAAAWSVIAYLFEKCSIFEDKPLEDVQ